MVQSDGCCCFPCAWMKWCGFGIASPGNCSFNRSSSIPYRFRHVHPARRQLLIASGTSPGNYDQLALDHTAQLGTCASPPVSACPFHAAAVTDAAFTSDGRWRPAQADGLVISA